MTQLSRPYTGHQPTSFEGGANICNNNNNTSSRGGTRSLLISSSNHSISSASRASLTMAPVRTMHNSVNAGSRRKLVSNSSSGSRGRTSSNKHHQTPSTSSASDGYHKSTGTISTDSTTDNSTVERDMNSNGSKASSRLRRGNSSNTRSAGRATPSAFDAFADDDINEIIPPSRTQQQRSQSFLSKSPSKSKPLHDNNNNNNNDPFSAFNKSVPNFGTGAFDFTSNNNDNNSDGILNSPEQRAARPLAFQGDDDESLDEFAIVNSDWSPDIRNNAPPVSPKRTYSDRIESVRVDRTASNKSKQSSSQGSFASSVKNPPLAYSKKGSFSDSFNNSNGNLNSINSNSFNNGSFSNVNNTDQESKSTLPSRGLNREKSSSLLKPPEADLKNVPKQRKVKKITAADLGLTSDEMKDKKLVAAAMKKWKKEQKLKKERGELDDEDEEDAANNSPSERQESPAPQRQVAETSTSNRGRGDSRREEAVRPRGKSQARTRRDLVSRRTRDRSVARMGSSTTDFHDSFAVTEDTQSSRAQETSTATGSVRRRNDIVEQDTSNGGAEEQVVTDIERSVRRERSGASNDERSSRRTRTVVNSSDQKNASQRNLLSQDNSRRRENDSSARQSRTGAPQPTDSRSRAKSRPRSDRDKSRARGERREEVRHESPQPSFGGRPSGSHFAREDDEASERKEPSKHTREGSVRPRDKSRGRSVRTRSVRERPRSPARPNRQNSVPSELDTDTKLRSLFNGDTKDEVVDDNNKENTAGKTDEQQDVEVDEPAVQNEEESLRPEDLQMDTNVSLDKEEQPAAPKNLDEWTASISKLNPDQCAFNPQTGEIAFNSRRDAVLNLSPLTFVSILEIPSNAGLDVPDFNSTDGENVPNVFRSGRKSKNTPQQQQQQQGQMSEDRSNRSQRSSDIRLTPMLPVKPVGPAKKRGLLNRMTRRNRKNTMNAAAPIAEEEEGFGDFSSNKDNNSSRRGRTDDGFGSFHKRSIAVSSPVFSIDEPVPEVPKSPELETRGFTTKLLDAGITAEQYKKLVQAGLVIREIK